MKIHVIVEHRDPGTALTLRKIETRLSRIERQGELMSAKGDELKTLVADLRKDIAETRGDIQEVIDKLETHENGMTADEVEEIRLLLVDAKSESRAAADVVPEPEAPPVEE